MQSDPWEGGGGGGGKGEGEGEGEGRGRGRGREGWWQRNHCVSVFISVFASVYVCSAYKTQHTCALHMNRRVDNFVTTIKSALHVVSQCSFLGYIISYIISTILVGKNTITPCSQALSAPNWTLISRALSITLGKLLSHHLCHTLS